ncbi:MAG TPA: response regulator transcription factor [Blastocatellia bacterium]|nr:response regulator transcription factor [Blastocatellia bacterium]
MAHTVNLLIVDDSERMRRMIKRLIKGILAEVWECDDGSQALEAYTEHRPDWVLMDIEMKDVDGITATREIITAFPDARIVIISNYDSDELREAASAAGATGYVVKENLIDLRRIVGA